MTNQVNIQAFLALQNFAGIFDDFIYPKPQFFL